jgi:hypothetical protein
MNYANNMHQEIYNLARKRDRAMCAPTKTKRKHHMKLMKYSLMAMGAFGLAKLFNSEIRQL